MGMEKNTKYEWPEVDLAFMARTLAEERSVTRRKDTFSYAKEVLEQLVWARELVARVHDLEAALERAKAWPDTLPGPPTTCEHKRTTYMEGAACARCDDCGAMVTPPPLVEAGGVTSKTEQILDECWQRAFAEGRNFQSMIERAKLHNRPYIKLG